MEKELVDYVDSKAEAIGEDFKMLSQLLWRKATELTRGLTEKHIALNIIEPCMGGGKLLSMMPKSAQATGYEKGFVMFQYAKGLLENTLERDVTLYNEPFEFEFSEPCFPTFNLAISIPYSDGPINTEYEKDTKCLKFTNYAFYAMARCLDVLYSDCFGVFAIPISLLEDEQFKSDRQLLLKNAKVINSEKYKNFAIIVIQKLK